MFNSVLRYYDEAVVEYFKDIVINDGIEFRSPQIQFSIPAANGYKLIKDPENNTAILPLIVITRTGISPNATTSMIKNSITRPRILNINPSTKVFDGVDIIYYNLNYKIAFFSLTREIHNTILEQLVFKLHKDHSIKAFIDILNHTIETNNYLTDISINDNMNYDQIDDTAERIFVGDAGFTMHASLYRTRRNVSSVLFTREEASIIEEDSKTFLVKETSVGN